ncbi:cell division protein FtsA [Candidatus Omnitrophota bacterium]
MHSDIICGLDIGASSIRALIVQPLGSHRNTQGRGRESTAKIFHSKEGKDASLRVDEKILAYSESPIKGFSKGVVTNLSLLSDAIEEAVSKAEGQARCRVRRIIANISGVHVRTFKSRGSIHISDRPSEITEQDIKRCIESARLIAMSLDREVIHLITEHFYIDDKMKIDDPLGLFGSKLDVDLNIVTSLVSILQNVTKAINLAGYELEDVIISGAATALAIFDHKDLEDGAVIIDVGKDLTEATLFMDGKLRDCFCFPFGSDDLTQVLQDKLKIMFEEAEELRIKYGIVTKNHSEMYDDSQIPITSLRNRQDSGYKDIQKRAGEGRLDSERASARTGSYKKNQRASVISRREISNLLFPKVEEIMQDVYKKIEPFLKQQKRLPRISVVGGISKLDGFIEAMEEIFCVPVEMGRIRNTKDLHDNVFACSLGLTRYEARKRAEKKPKYVPNANSFVDRFISKVQTLLSEYF